MGRTDILKNIKYIPEQYDLIWINFNPAHGNEQKGRRPALVLSDYSFNKTTGMAFLCPISSVFKKHLLNTTIISQKINGQILVYQTKSLDWMSRKITFIEKADKDVVDDVKAKLSVILNL
jgi:mRNA interferase MazF